MSEEIYDDSVTNPQPENQGSGNLDFDEALKALPPDQQQALADQMQSHVDGINSLKNQAIAQRAQQAATNSFNAAFDAHVAQYGTRPNPHQVASMYAAARARAGFRD